MCRRDDSAPLRERAAMPFLDTEPADIDQVDYVGPWERFRVDDTRQCLAALNEACRTDAPVTLGASDGMRVTVTLWAVDEAAGRLTFNVDPSLGAAAAVAAKTQIWAALYLGDVKLQFSLRALVLSETAQVKRVGAAAVRTLHAQMPIYMYCMPRRRALRLRHGGLHMPMLRFAHPAVPELRLSLPVLDISATGCALQQPTGAPALQAGTTVEQVEVELDEETFLFTDLSIAHVSASRSARSRQLRVGCRWRNMPGSAQEVLEHWIRSGRRSRDLVSLNFD